MKILPIDNVEYLRPYACSSRSDCTKCPSFGRDCHFPNPYKATKQELESVPYITEIWPLDDAPLLHVGRDKCIVVTFAELCESFDTWNQYDDPLLDTNERYDSVYDWLRECIDSGLHPCRILD